MGETSNRRRARVRLPGRLCRHRSSRQVLGKAALLGICLPSDAASGILCSFMIYAARGGYTISVKGGWGSLLRRADLSASPLVGCRQEAEMEMPEVR